VALPKAAIQRLTIADHDSVDVFACTNYIEYQDGSGMIID
jgi:hypothetical protein